MTARSRGPGVTTVTRLPCAPSAFACAEQHAGEQLPDPALEPQVRLERMVGFGAGHRREHVDLLHVRAAPGRSSEVAERTPPST